jgi:hypothetical protein
LKISRRIFDFRTNPIENSKSIAQSETESPEWKK